ncbi:MAG: autotransporter domain-containing protein [Candidatus Omnitrophota bacterium]
MFGFGAVLLAFAAPAHAGTYTVLNTGDAGADTLRAAVTSLNSSGVSGTIAFGSGAAGTIALESNLDTLGFETIFDTSNYNITLTGHNGGTSAGSWFKFDGAGTGTFTFGTGTAWTIGGGLVVGDNANGSMTVSGGGDVSNAFTSYVGGNAGSSGAVTVTGAGSTWVNTQDMFIGSGSTGTLTISAGGLVSDTYGNIGGFAGGNGTVTVTGAGSTWNNTNDIFVGKNDDGVLNIQNGGVVNDVQGFVASEVGSAGTVNVDGAGSKWTNTGGLTVGRNGPGQLHITGGGDVSNTYVDLAYSGTGVATVDGDGSTWDSDGDFNVGKANTATLDVTGGGDVISNFGYIGRDATANGTATIDGSGSTWTNDFGLTVGDSGTGKLIISDGGSVSVTAGAGTTTIASVGGSTGTLTIGAGGASGTIDTAIINGGSGTATLKFNHTDASYTFDPQLTGSLKVEQNGAGTTIISGNNTYTGTTAINAGTLVASNSGALGNGSAVTVAAGATLDVGTTDVTVNNTYTQNGTLKVTVASPSSSGRITSNANAAVAATSIVDVTVPGSIYIPNNATFTVVDGAGGADVSAPATITSSDPRLRFSALSLNGDLILTANRSGTGFSSISTNSNAAAVGAVLDNISNPSADMTTVLNTLEGLSDSGTASALDTVTPVVDNGVIASSNLSLNQFVGVITERLTGLYARARGGETGVSAGSEGLNGFEAWGQGFGEYLHQEPRGLSNGYRATVWGTAIGGDLPAFNNRVRLGLSGGYSSGDINSKDNSGKTDIDSYQGTLYGGYADVENPYYVNGSFSFAYNKYDSSRHIAVGAIERTADSDYDGQQYSVMFDGGYTLKSGKFGITPIASLQYMRLHIEGYTETNAGALNLSVKGENYDMLQSGLGMKLERPFETKTGTVIPEVHAKWLHDFIGDRQETTSTFSGGGGSFATRGFDPARNAMDVGAKLTLLSENNWSLETNYDFEYKEDFTSHTGWADIRYRF